MKDLIEALTILAKYQEPTRNPTLCEHDVLRVLHISAVTETDAVRLDELGFCRGEMGEYISFRFGSA